MSILSLFIIILTVVSALVAVFSKDRVVAVLALAIMSIGLTAAFYFLQAPDVAMAEAVVGAGLSTGLFLFALKKMDAEKTKED